MFRGVVGKVCRFNMPRVRTPAATEGMSVPCDVHLKGELHHDEGLGVSIEPHLFIHLLYSLT